MEQIDNKDELLTMHDFIRQVHEWVERKEGGKPISRVTMAKRLGISRRAYMDYMLGANKLQPMVALIRLLAQLPNEEIVRAVRMWGRHDMEFQAALADEKVNPPPRRGPKPKHAQAFQPVHEEDEVE